MNQEFSFETIPFEITPEFQGEMFEEEVELERGRPFTRGRNKSIQSKTSPRKNSRLPNVRPKVVTRGVGIPWGVVRDSVDITSYPPESSGSERIRWIQDCLNQTMTLQLPVTGIMGAETRNAVRDFQQQQGLRVSGIVSPRTEQKLSAICEDRQNATTDTDELEQEFVVHKSCEIIYRLSLKDQDAVSVDNNGMLVANPSLPKTQGIYVIKNLDGTPYYVGVAASTNGVKARFDDRVKAIRDFGGISLKTINRKVDVYTVTGIKGACLVHRRKGGSAVLGQPVKNYAELFLLEQHLINKLKTLGKGNKNSEKILPKSSDIQITFTRLP